MFPLLTQITKRSSELPAFPWSLSLLESINAAHLTPRVSACLQLFTQPHTAQPSNPSSETTSFGRWLWLCVSFPLSCLLSVLLPQYVVHSKPHVVVMPEGIWSIPNWDPGGKTAPAPPSLATCYLSVLGWVTLKSQFSYLQIEVTTALFNGLF